jgi:hypothetical protein
MDEAGGAIQLAYDPRLETARGHARASQAEPAAFLQFAEVFGDRLPGDPVFVPAFVDALSSLRAVGVRPTLERWLQGAR